MSISVVDLNEEAKEEQPSPAIEEEAENKPELVVDTSNEIIEETVPVETKEETKDETKEVPKAKAKAKPKPKPYDIVPCPDCNKNMTYKNLRYKHKCYSEPPPVKPQAKPKAKQAPRSAGVQSTLPKPKPKPVPQTIYEEEEEARQSPATSREAMPQHEVIRQQPPPIVNPLANIQQHYQLLQQQYMKQKQEKYNNLCQNMFKTKLKKR